MSSTTLAPRLQDAAFGDSIQQQVGIVVDDLIAQLPDPAHLTTQQRRGIIARYASVLEGNFIYWMTAASIAAKADDVRPILAENLFDEVRDAHPAMLRRFAIAANAMPTDTDALATNRELNDVRVFLGKLQGVQSVLTMAFFECWIQRFMGYLADLAVSLGSSNLEYTDVHGVCDITHTAELFRALQLEMDINPIGPDADLFEGVDLLRTLILAILQGPTPAAAA